MQTIDCMGKPCPIPVIEAKKALAQESVAAVLLLVDNELAVQNLEKMANGLGYSFSYSQPAPQQFAVNMGKPTATPPTTATTAAPTLAAPLGTEGCVVFVTTECLGNGDVALGKLLMKGFLYALTELPTPPKAVFFANGGAHLTTAGANTVADLLALEQKGTQIFTCGACIQHYGLQGKLAVGAITDMYTIAQALTSAANTVCL